MSEIAPQSINTTSSRPGLERKARPQKDQALNCPRCNSTNTKFCYYNNYSLTQPRYFCKTCRRYWTEGGTLRNVPVGGGSKKNKRTATSTSTSSSSSAAHNIKLPDLNPSSSLPSISQLSSSQNPNKITTERQDLNLAFPAATTQHYTTHHPVNIIPQFLELPKIENNSNSSTFSALHLLRTGLIPSRGLSNNPFMSTQGAPDLNGIYTSGLTLGELKPAGLSFPVEGLGSRYSHGVQENGGRGMIFPFGSMKQVSDTNNEVSDHHQNKEHENSGYWNGTLGGGSSW